MHVFYFWTATRDASDSSDSRSNANANTERNLNEVNRGIRREVTRLSERWNNLISQTDRWQAKLDDVLPVSPWFEVGLFIWENIYLCSRFWDSLYSK